MEPVKLIFRAMPLLVQVSTTEEALEVVTTFRTPSGRPASRKICTRARDVNGVSSAGLKTMVQPAATAGAILRAPMASGKFHGVTSTQGPTGSLVIMIRVLPSTEVVWSPPMRTASSENQRSISAP